MTTTLTREQARRIAVRAQLLDAHRPSSLVQTVDQLTLMQIDPTKAIAPSADLVAWSRLGDAYDHSDLTFALEQERSLVEFSSFIFPMDEIETVLALSPGRIHHSAVDWVKANNRFRTQILDRLRADGPLVAGEIEDTSEVPWASSGWTNDRSVLRMIELLNRMGDVAIAGRRGKLRTWDLPERVYPADLRLPSIEEASTVETDRRLASLGIARPGRKDTSGGEVLGGGSAGVACTVAGVDGEWRVDAEALAALEDGFAPRTAFLSPFDRLVYDRDRALDLFGFEYVLEMYKPAAKRRWGYFALPILHGERLVGKLDAKVDHKKGLLNVFAVHEDFGWTAEIGDAVEAEIDALAGWLGVEITHP
ncbi:MAG: DNA glycosylase AlkZ-like family protein [Nocardioides sp.]|uniref:DNA glycosylase AlkZ-like family protein n=1 Tax=Nocardioides sp. TaxID=35761 RepID=UPI003D6B0EE6